MRLASRFDLCLVLLLLLPASAARAMHFVYIPGSASSGGVISASGIVRTGDEDQLHTALHNLPAGAPLATLLLDSPGGDLEEGLHLAAAVREAGLETVVGDGAKCASACFIVFAAGSHVFASTSALVGVHSASYGGHDTPDARAATVLMARRLSVYGVPDAILGKLVSAQPNQIWWLSRSDLESMRVDMNVPPAVLVATHNAAPPPSPVPAKPLPPTPAPAAPIVHTTAQAIKPGFHIERPAHGYQIVPPTGGIRTWRPNSAG